MLPRFLYPLSMRFRRRRNRLLVQHIEEVRKGEQHPFSVLDVGGSFRFWKSLDVPGNCMITLLNLPRMHEKMEGNRNKQRDSISFEVGDARDLEHMKGRGFDFVVCNSVLEHVGSWSDIEQAASEIVSVAPHGWVQVPAFEFPIEQHYVLPFVHWFGDPIKIFLVKIFRPGLRRKSISKLRIQAYQINLLTRNEMKALFPEAKVFSERFFLLPKSHIAKW